MIDVEAARNEIKYHKAEIARILREHEAAHRGTILPMDQLWDIKIHRRRIYDAYMMIRSVDGTTVNPYAGMEEFL